MEATAVAVEVKVKEVELRKTAQGVDLPQNVMEWFTQLSRNDQQSVIAKLFEGMKKPDFRIIVKDGSREFMQKISAIVLFADRHGITYEATRRGDSPVFKFGSAADRNRVLIGIGIEALRAKEVTHENSCNL